MILGVYWYFEFPTGLYHHDLFKFSKGQGGFADWPAQLSTSVVADNPERTIGQLQDLIKKYKDGLLFIYQDDNYLKISTGGHQIFDYDFLLIGEVENILKRGNVKLSEDERTVNSKFIKLANSDRESFISPRKGFLQIVGSPKRKFNSETASLRFDCNLSIKNKLEFIQTLKEICVSENIDVFYFFDKDFKENSNLMIFFTNGRQGINLQEKKYTNTISLEDKIENACKLFNVDYGHKPGFSLYPNNGPKIERVIDKEFTIE